MGNGIQRLLDLKTDPLKLKIYLSLILPLLLDICLFDIEISLGKLIFYSYCVPGYLVSVDSYMNLQVPSSVITYV